MDLPNGGEEKQYTCMYIGVVVVIIIVVVVVSSSLQPPHFTLASIIYN